MKKIIAIITLFLVFAFISCNPEKIYLECNQSEKTIEVGQSEKVELNTNINYDKLSFSLENDCLEIDSKGNLKAVKVGTCKVTINYDAFEVSITYNVVKKTNTLKVNNISDINLGQTLELEIIVDDESSTSFVLTYDTSLANILLKDNKITINPLKEGKLVLTVLEEYSKLTAEVEINIKGKKEQLQVTCESEILLGKDYLLTVNRKLDEVIVSSSDNILVIDNTIRGLEKGLGYIKVVDKETHEEIVVNVKVVKVITDFEIACEEIRLGDEVSVNLNYDNNCDVSFKITTNQDGILVNGLTLKGLKEGTYTITITEEYSNITIEITVNVTSYDILEEDLNWAISQTGTCGAYECVLPLENPQTNTTFTWSSSDESIFMPDGLLDFVEFDTVVEVTVTAYNNGKSKSKTFEYTVIGTSVQELADEFIDQFGRIINKSLTIITKYNGYYGNSYVKWHTSDEQILTSQGEYNRPLKDSKITIYYTVCLDEPRVERTYEKEFEVLGMTLTDIIDPVTLWIKNNVGENGLIDENTVFPDYYDDYDTQILWLDEYGNNLKIDKYIGNPIFSQGIDVVAKITFGKYKGEIPLHFNFLLKDFENMWDKIELFLDTISSLPVQTYKYNLITWKADEYGYIPFYENENAKVIENILPYTYGKQRTGLIKKSTEYIVVHDTGNSKAGATASMHNTYIQNLNNNPDSTHISWHFTVGDDGIYQHLPLDEVAYHAGDGSYEYGDEYFNTSYNAWSIGGGNRNGIGIESCVNEGCDYTEVMRRLAKLVSELLIKFDLSIDRVKQHNAFSGKNCPQVMRENNRWNEFITLVQLEYFAKTQLSDVVFSWESTSDNLNNHGKVVSKCKEGTKATYKVTVTYKNETKQYNYESVITER